VPARRVFICIGGAPNTEWARTTPIIRDSGGYLVTGPDLQIEGRPPAVWPLERPPFFLETSVPGSLRPATCGTARSSGVASAAGEGAMAVAFIHRYLAAP
jgi:thioredoxin reductase (NADPH)